MKIVKLEMNFDDIRHLIKKHNKNEYGKESFPIELLPNDINDIAREILKMHREVLPQANVIKSFCCKGNTDNGRVELCPKCLDSFRVIC